jgi:hypothetical protein
MAKVEAPNKDYNGPGPGDAVFVDGVADTDDEAALNYYRGAGYKVSGKVLVEHETPEPPDPREVTHVVSGTRLRDAAVDPHEDDFLAPVNAGEANPHGPAVVAPEIHASGPAGIRPGEVFVEDVAKQEKREKEFAEARLINQVTAGEAVRQEVPDLKDRGELGLSDPGSAERGRAEAKEADEQPSLIAIDGDPEVGDTADLTTDETATEPAKSDNKAAWVDYAVAKGADREKSEAMKKADLVEQYGS